MKKVPSIQDNVFKEIELGKYKDCYLVYNRKSTDEPENQKNSIKYQKSENTRFAFRENLKIASISIDGICVDGIISEKHSAFKENTAMHIGEDGIVQYKIDRPKFFKMIQFLNSGNFKGVIVLCWDRISRNKGDETVVRKLMKQGVDFRFVLATYDKTSSGALHMDIDGMFAEHHSRVTSEKVKINIRNLREKGVCTFKAPVGYLNLGTMENKPLDPERAPIIKQLFEKYATGEYSLHALEKWAINQGFTMPAIRRRRTNEEIQMEDEDEAQLNIQPVNNILRANSIQRIFKNPFYIGKIYDNNGQLIESKSHQPIISDELFSVVQIRLQNKNTSLKYTNKITYPFRGLLRCGMCNRRYTPYTQKGHIYLGHRTSDCSNTAKNISADKVTNEILKFLSSIVLSQHDKDMLNAEADTQIKLLQIKRASKDEQAERRKRKLKEDLDYLMENKISLLKNEVYTHESMHQQETKLKNELLNIRLDELVNDFCYEETIKEVIKLSELLNNLIPLVKKANPVEIDKITRLVMSELSIHDNTLKYKCRNGFEALESYSISSGGLLSWLSELPSLTRDLKYGVTILLETF